MKLAALRAGAILLFATLLQACGGGDGNGNGGPGPPPPDPRVSANTTNVAVSAIPGEAGPTFDVVATITNPPISRLWASFDTTVNGITNIEFDSSSKERADFNIVFKSPAEIPNGHYEDTLTFHICSDPDCEIDIQGSPITVQIGYDVAGGTRATLSREQIRTETDGRDLTDHHEVVRMTFERPLQNPFFRIDHTHQALEGVVPDVVSPTKMDFDILYRPGAALTFGPHEDMIRITACYDSSCSKELLGSPFRVQTTHNVTIYPEAGYESLEVASRVPLGHDVIDAEFSRSLNKIVMVGSKPANALYLYDVATGVERQQLLAARPQAVSVAPDGLTAAVGHVNQLSIVDLANVGQPGAPAPVMLDDGTDSNEVVLDGHGKVYVFPDCCEPDPPRSVDIATNTVQAGTDPLFRRARARLHPSGTAIYEANTLYTPTGISRWDASTGVANWLHYFSYHGQYEVCGNLWFNDTGDRIYTACGHVFTSSPVEADDLQYVGTLPITNTVATPGVNSHVFRSLSIDAARNELALIEVMNGCETVLFFGACYTHFALYDATTLERQAIYAIQPVTVDDVIYPQLGHFVFHDAANGRKYLISRLEGVRDPAAAFYLSVVE